MVGARRVKRAGSARTEGARRATGVGADGAAVGAGALAPGQRWSASRKRDVVLRLLRGESLEMVSREVGLELYRLEAWQARALAGLELGLKAQAGEPLAAELDAAKRHIGELSMEIERWGAALRPSSRSRKGSGDSTARSKRTWPGGWRCGWITAASICRTTSSISFGTGASTPASASLKSRKPTGSSSAGIARSRSKPSTAGSFETLPRCVRPSPRSSNVTTSAGASRSWRIARHSKRASNTSYAMPRGVNVCPRNRVRYTTTIWRSIRQNGMHWRRTPVARDAVARQVEGDVTEGHEPAAGLRLVSAYRIAQVCLRGWQVRLGDSSRPSPASARRWMSCRIRTVALDMAYFSTTSAQKTAGSTAVSLDPDDHPALCLRGDRARVAVQPRRNHRRHVRGSPPQSLLAARARADDP